MDAKKIAIAAISHSIFCDQNILSENWNGPNEYFEDTFGCSIKEAEEILGVKFDFGETWATTTYKCKYCGHKMKFTEEEMYGDGHYHPDGEEQLWGHIQLDHEDIFADVCDLDTPLMLEECYEEE
jgi:hypothetical protein